MVKTARAPGALHPLGVLAVTLLTFLAVWASVAAGRWSPVFSQGTRSEDVEPTPEPTIPEDVTTLPTDYGLSMRGLVMALLLTMAVVAVLSGIGFSLKAVSTAWQGRSKRVDDDDGKTVSSGMLAPELAMPDVVELREGIAEAWSRLVEHRDPTDAIQAAWVAVEEAAGRSGVPREPADTPTEFTVAVLDRTAVDPAAIRTLLRLYHRARFSTHGANAEDVETARECLSTLAEGLER